VTRKQASSHESKDCIYGKAVKQIFVTILKGQEANGWPALLASRFAGVSVLDFDDTSKYKTDN
jgi:hypothetical protein